MQTQDYEPTDGRPAARHWGNPPAVRRLPVALLALYFAASLLGPGWAAEPRQPPIEIPFADPQKMFDRVLGQRQKNQRLPYRHSSGVIRTARAATTQCRRGPS